MYCTTGRHYWTQPADAAKCCNGYRRILVLNPAAEDCDHHTPSMEAAGVRYGFTWLPVEDSTSEYEHTS